MSQWTHVAGIIRFDGLDHNHFIEFVKKCFGPTWDYDSTSEEVLASAQAGVPYGTEGSIQYLVEYVGRKTDHSTTFVCGNVVIYGDLRDFNSVEAIIDWLDKSINKMNNVTSVSFFVRQLVVEVNIENDRSYILKARYNLDETITIERL